MLKMNRVNAKAYYNTLPPRGHQCGDIWRGLPSFGMLGDKPCTGLVITPACDLSWQKSDTLTYLPIIPIRAYFSIPAALPLVIEKILSSLQATGYEPLPNWSADSYVPPIDEELTTLASGLHQYTLAQQRSQKVLKLIERIEAGFSILRIIRSCELGKVDSGTLAKALGSDWPKLKERIIRNSYSSALHFLPADCQNPVFSGVTEHSVALFRCPITVPVRMLNYAEESSNGAWEQVISAGDVPEAMRVAFRAVRPIKLLSLKSAFLSDLLTRYSALYNRVGSPDFTDETVEAYGLEVDL